MELENKKILFLGDSITEGVGVSTPDKLYWKRFENDGCQVYGYGISGTRIARQVSLHIYPYVDDNYFVTRLPQMQDSADVVVVFGGTNDFGHGDAALGSMNDRTDDTFYGATHNLFISLQKKYPNATIVLMTPLHRLNENRYYNDLNIRTVGNLKTYRDILVEVAQFHKIPVLDLYNLCPINPEMEGHMQQYIPDGLHPNDEGHELIYQMLRDLLKNL